MKNKIAILVLLLLSLTSFADSGERIIFDSTMRRVDAGGEFVLYKNFNALNAELQKSLPEAIHFINFLQNDRKHNKIFDELAQIILATLNMNALQSSAVSSKEYSAGVFVTRSVLYYGNNLNKDGLHSVFSKVNRPLRWQDLPATTKIAFRTTINPEKFDRVFTRNCRASKDPVIRALPDSDAAAVLRNLSGEITFLLCAPVKSPGQWHIMLQIPDSNGAIAALLKKNFPPAPGTNVAKILSATPLLAEITLSYNGKSLIFGQDITAVAAQQTLGSQPHIQLLANHLPANGVGFLVWNMDAQTATLLNMLTRQHGFDVFAKSTLISVQSAHQDSFTEVAVSDFSLVQTLQTLPLRIYGQALLPALARSRSKASSAACVNNLKQIITAFFLYDRKSASFPAPNGRAGLQKLVDAGLLAPQQLVCPANKAKGPIGSAVRSSGEKPVYIYIGAGISLDKLQNPAAYPVLFDAPGCAHGSNISVAFADGHVTQIRVPNYSEPSQVIGMLAKKYKYPPEILNSLLKAVSEAR